MLTRLSLGITLAAVLTACGTTPTSAPASGTAPPASGVALRRWVPSSPEACPAVRTEGTLVRHPRSGAGLRDNAGTLWQVIWPTDYTAREEDGRFVVLDGRGNVVAHEGDYVEIGGADVGGATWLGCGGMRVTTP
jgi:hypothetical protein